MPRRGRASIATDRFLVGSLEDVVGTSVGAAL